MDTNSKKSFEKATNVGVQRVSLRTKGAPLQGDRSNQTQSASKRFSLHRLQSGQAVILIAFMMIALLASLGLAIDGGGMFFLYRDVQNAADAGMRAAVYARCTNNRADDAVIDQSVLDAALDAVADNGFTDNGSTVIVDVNIPPSSGPAAPVPPSDPGDRHFVEVIVEAVKPSYFIYLVYKGELRVEGRAVGECNPPFLPEDLRGVIALGDCGGPNKEINWAGARTYIEGGGHANGDLYLGNAGDAYGDWTWVLSGEQHNNMTVTPPMYQASGPMDDPLEQVDINWFMPANPSAPDENGAVDIAIDEDNPLIIGGTIIRSYWQYAWKTGEQIPPFDGNEYAHYHDATGDPNYTLPEPGETLHGLYVVIGDVTVDYPRTGTNATIVATGTIKVGTNGPLSLMTRSFPFIPSALDPSPTPFWMFATWHDSNCGANNEGLLFTGGLFAGVMYAPYASFKGSSDMDLNVGAILSETVDYHSSDLLVIWTPDPFDPIPGSSSASE